MVFEDGPAPFFKRLQVNSSSINFLKLKHLDSPEEVKEKRLIQVKRNSINKTQKKSHLLKNQIKENDSVIKYFNNTYLQKQLSLNFKELNMKVLEKESEIISKVNSSSKI